MGRENELSCEVMPSSSTTCSLKFSPEIETRVIIEIEPIPQIWTLIFRGLRISRSSSFCRDACRLNLVRLRSIMHLFLSYF